MPEILSQIGSSYPYLLISMRVDNTENLLKMLDSGSLDFVLIEGNLNKPQYTYKLLSKEPFIGICSTSHKLAGKTVPLSQAFKERLIVREKGSGTRNILHNYLKEKGYGFYDFSSHLEIGNMNAIKVFVKNNLGITFMYREAAKKELGNTLCEFKLKDTEIIKEFNFVFLKQNIDQQNCLKWYNKIKEIRENIKP